MNRKSRPDPRRYRPSPIPRRDTIPSQPAPEERDSVPPDPIDPPTPPPPPPPDPNE